jgi:Transglycosylase SLT domain
MRFWQLACIAAAFAASPLCVTVVAKIPTGQSNAEVDVTEQPSNFLIISATPASFSQRFSLLLHEEESVVDNVNEKEARLEGEDFSFRDHSVGAMPPKPHSSYLAYYPYSELPPDKKPANIVLDSLKDIPIGTPIEEIKRAADAFGLDFSFMKAVAKIESDFDPKQRTGSYIGLFQLNRYEFRKYGSGNITSPRDNAIAAAYKFVTEATLFELDTHREPTFSDLYLIHQQGWQGAAEHVSHPERIAWKSMCGTDEGRQKGERWCKRAIWGNTLPTIKHVWKSVDKLTSGAFVDMWRERVDHLYARYSEATPSESKH